MDAMTVTRAQQALLEKLAGRVPPGTIVTDPELIAPWLVDWRGRYRGRTAALLQPASTKAVATIVALAAAHGVALTPQGGNTSMVGGATPPSDGSTLILSLRRLNRMRSIDTDADLAVAESGVVLSDLHAAALDAGRRFPLTLGARGSATVGGLVSTNAGGTQVLRWGTMRGLIAGLEAVLPDGSVHHGLAALKKDNRGYDLKELLVGAEGTLGIVTAASLRLAPAIAARAVAWAGVSTPHAALALLRRLQAATSATESFEIIHADTLAAGLAHLGLRAPLDGVHAWHVLIEAVALDTADETPGDLLTRLLGDALDAGLIEDATLAASEAQAEAFWRLRDSLSDAERGTGPAVQFDMSVAVDAMPDFLIEGARAAEARFPGTHATGFGHLGDGNIHFHIRAPAGAEREHWLPDEGARVTRFVHDLVAAAGGSISAEHGIGQMKRDELARLSGPARMAVLRGIKQALDPQGLMNPGKLVLAPGAIGQ